MDTLQLSAGLSVWDSRSVVTPLEVSEWERGCSGFTPTHWNFKNPLWVGADTEMGTQYLPAH